MLAKAESKYFGSNCVANVDGVEKKLNTSKIGPSNDFSENGSKIAQIDIYVQLFTYRTNVVKNLKHLFHIRFLYNKVLQNKS